MLCPKLNAMVGNQLAILKTLSLTATKSIYSLPSQELDGAALRAAPSNS